MYADQIEMLKKYFQHDPIVLIYDDLIKNPGKFVTTLAGDIHASIDVSGINFRKKHVSYSEKQLKAIKAAGRYLRFESAYKGSNKAIRFFAKLYHKSKKYSVLYGANILPASLFTSHPLIDQADLDVIDHHFEDDWKYCLTQASNNQNVYKN